MCGRYTRYLPWSEIHRLYRLTQDLDRARNTAPARNVRPTDSVFFVTPDGNGDHKLHEGRWGLIPWWAKEPIKAATWNAKAEESDKKPMFRDALNRAFVAFSVSDSHAPQCRNLGHSRRPTKSLRERI